jgi:Mg2+ and Co2+ transporter CorA
VQVYTISGAGLKEHAPGDVSALLSEPELIVWVDVPHCGPDQAQMLDEWFGFHPLALRDCVERNHIAKAHVYDDHVFSVLHARTWAPAGTSTTSSWTSSSAPTTW